MDTPESRSSIVVTTIFGEERKTTTICDNDIREVDSAGSGDESEFESDPDEFLHRESVSIKNLTQPVDATQDDKFPVDVVPSPNNSDLSNSNKEIYCYCQQPYDGFSTMIDCERCKEFFHTSCIHLDVEISLDDDLSDFQYYCNKCVCELEDEVQVLTDKLEDLQYSVEKNTSLIDQFEKDLESLKEKNQIKMGNLQKEHASKIKTMQDSFSKCDEQRKQNQKNLTKSKTAAQALSEKLSKTE